LPEASSDQSVPGPLVLNGKVFLQTGDEVTAVDTTTHEVAWSKPMPGSNTFLNSNVSSSGTSVFALDGCDVVALNQADGVEQWRARVPLTDMDCSGWWIFQGPGDKGTVVSGDTVFANFGFFGIAAFDVATGDVRWRANPPAHNVTIAVTEQFVVADAFDDGISVLDRATGDLVGRLGPDKVSPRSGVTAVGDLVLYNTTEGRVGAVDLTTMEQVWTSSVVSAVAMPGRPVVSGGRIWGYSSTDFNGTASQIVALGP
jgi:outer membrane protein assembly factor BamB